MVINDGKNVLTCTGIVMWDGITNPELKDGRTSYSIKIAIPEMAPEKGELEQLATTTLQTSEFKGQFPHGGNWPLIPIDMQKHAADAAILTGRISINAKTGFTPEVFDVNGNPLDAMTYGNMLYPGAVVQLIVGCYAFNNMSKGLAFNLEGIKIVDATAPKLQVGGGMATAALQSAFAGGAPQQGMPQQGMPQQGMPAAPGAVQPATDFLPNAAAAAAQPAPVDKMYSVNGQNYPESALRASGWTDEQLATQATLVG